VAGFDFVAHLALKQGKRFRRLVIAKLVNEAVQPFPGRHASKCTDQAVQRADAVIRDSFPRSCHPTGLKIFRGRLPLPVPLVAELGLRWSAQRWGRDVS
jgi:hypothetical protein